MTQFRHRSSHFWRNNSLSCILQQLAPDTLKAHLYGPDFNPTSCVRWGETFEILRDWLLHKTRYQETKRQGLLGTLQTEMLENAIHAERQQDILLEAQRMLDLVPTLCEEAPQQVRDTFIDWRNSICGAKRIIYSEQNYRPLSTKSPQSSVKPLSFRSSLSKKAGTEVV